MKRKVLVLALALSLFTTFSVSAYTAAVGAEFALQLGSGLPSSALLSFRLPKFPAVLGLGLSVPKGGNGSLALMADWWLASGNLVGFLNYYVGPGAYLTIADGGADLGLRVPVGVNAFPIKPLELFVELAPAVNIISPGGVGLDFNLQAGFGFRFWF